MRIGIRGDKQPAIRLVFTYAAHPVADRERLAILFNPLQVADGLDIVGQHGTDGDGCLLNFLLDQVGGRGVLQVRTQLIDFDGQHGINQLFVTAVLVPAHQVGTFGKDGATGTLPERIFLRAHRDKGVGDVVEIRQRQALFPQIPGRTARIQRVEDFIQ